MKRGVSALKWIAGFMIAVTLSYYIYEPVWNAAKWVAWNWIQVDFVATCRVFENDLDDDINDLEFLTGTYSGEFKREIIAQWDGAYRDITLTIEADGTLTVPLGFYLPVDPFWSRFGGNPEPEERGYSVSAGAAYQILQRRLADGLDTAPYLPYAERSYHDPGGPRRLNAPVCGFMQLLALKGGALARP